MVQFAFVLSLLSLTASTVHAQAYVVDAANGPGANYTSIAAAVAAVPNNSVLFVRPGNYTGFTIQAKAVTILGGAGVGVTGPVSVDSTSQSQSVVLRGLTVNEITLCYTSGLSAISLDACQGPVLIDECTTPAGFLFGRCVCTPLSVVNCSQVFVRDCGLAGRTEVDSSTVTFEGGDLFGWIADSQADPDTPGLYLSNSRVQILDAEIRGGLGYQWTSGSPAIEMQDSDLRLLSGTIVTAGSGSVGQLPAAIAATGTGVNQLRADPAVGWTNNQPATQGVTAQTNPMPAVRASSGTAGGAVGATVTTQIGDLVILVVGLRGAPSQVPGFVDGFWLLPGSYSFYVVAQQTSSANPITGSIAVPAGTSFEGLQLVWHAVSSGPVTGFQNSNPGVSLIY